MKKLIVALLLLALLGSAALLITSRMLKLATLVVLGIATLAFLAWLARRPIASKE